MFLLIKFNDFDSCKAPELIEYIEGIIREENVEGRFSFTRKGIKDRNLEIENETSYEYTTVEQITNHKIEVRQKDKVYSFMKNNVNMRGEEHWCTALDDLLMKPINKKQFKDFILELVK